LNYAYFYGLPANNTTSNQIRRKILEHTRIDIAGNQPRIRRDHTKPEWTAIVKLDNKEHIQTILKKMRFFDWFNDDPSQAPIQIRVLPYYKDMRTGDDMHDQNVYVNNLPADMTHQDLFNEIIKHVPEEDVRSVKVSMDYEKNKSNKYGFATFSSKEAADMIRSATSDTGIEFHPYNPTNNKEMRKAFNNVIV
jgi:hypothetical protein